MHGILGAFATWATDFMEKLGYLGLALLTALENVIPIVPSEVIQPLAGFLAGEGRMNFFLALLSATIGSVAGAVLLYLLGYWFGEWRLRAVVQRWGRWVGLHEGDIDKADAWFNRYGGLAVMICRVIPVVRALISLPAGLRRMPLGMFALYTAVGSLVWNTLLISAGWMLGDNWDKVETYLGPLSYVVVLLILAAGVWWVWHRIIKPYRELA
ncbi:MAG TPA: DedA family protein [Thermomicrobiales bacterium]|nr:DedA family protein [Thermomicrobiales bacterium]